MYGGSVQRHQLFFYAQPKSSLSPLVVIRVVVTCTTMNCDVVLSLQHRGDQAKVLTQITKEQPVRSSGFRDGKKVKRGEAKFDPVQKFRTPTKSRSSINNLSI